MGDDGRLISSPGQPIGPYRPRIQVVDPDCKYLLQSIDPGYEGASLQGVAVDTSGSEDTVWAATSAEGHIRHYTLDGVEIAEDAYAPSLPGNVNGLAYDPENHAVWVGSSTSPVVQLISCDPNMEPREIVTINTGSTPDQLHYDPVRKLLYYTVGANGYNGSVRVYRTETGQDSVAYGQLPMAQSIEGVFIDRESRKLYISNDAGLHTEGTPTFNILIRYDIELIN